MIIVGQGPTALTEGAGAVCLDIFTLDYKFSLLSPSFWETARYRLKYSQRAVMPKTTNQPSSILSLKDLDDLAPQLPSPVILLGDLMVIIGWSGGAMVLGKLPVPGRPTIWITVGQGPTALAVGADGVVWTFLLSSILSLLFLPLFGRRPDID